MADEDRLKLIFRRKGIARDKDAALAYASGGIFVKNFLSQDGGK
jgi:hypothetical protein